MALGTWRWRKTVVHAHIGSLFVAVLGLPPVWAADTLVRVVAGDELRLNCPERLLERVPGGPPRLLSAGGDLEAVASTDRAILVQGAPGHRGWVPQSCADRPTEVVPLQTVTVNGPPRRGPAVTLHWAPGCEGCEALTQSATELAQARPDLRVLLVAHGERSAILQAAPHPSILELWVDEEGLIKPEDELPVVEYWAPDATRHRLQDSAPGWPREAVELRAPPPPPERYSLDTMNDIDQVSNGALQKPYLSTACEVSAVQLAEAQDAHTGRYIQWLATLVHDRKLHDMALWDLATVGVETVGDEKTIQCILDTVDPFVALRASAVPVFTTTHVHSNTDLEAGLQQLRTLAKDRGLRFILLHIGEGSLTESRVRGNSTIPTRALQLSPSEPMLARVAGRLGLSLAGGTVLVVY